MNKNKFTMQIQQKNNRVEIFPVPPNFPHSDILLKNYIKYEDPKNKWMNHVLKINISSNLIFSSEGRMNLFYQYYQFPDMPYEVTNDKCDRHYLFHERSLLYFNPLCFALYMKKELPVKWIINSGLNSISQVSYATHVFTRHEKGDIMEILPICIAIRREYFEILPTLLKKDPEALTRTIQLRYVNETCKKLYKFHDLFHYTVEILKKNNTFNIYRFLETVLTRCMPFESQSTTYKEFIENLFRRILEMMYYDDFEGFITPKLLQCLELLLKTLCFNRNNVSLFTMKVSDTSKFIITIDPLNCDNECSFGLMIAIYFRLFQRQKYCLFDLVAKIMFKFLHQSHWLDKINKIPMKILWQICLNLPKEKLNIPLEAINLMIIHIDKIKNSSTAQEMKTMQKAQQQNIKKKIQESMKEHNELVNSNYGQTCYPYGDFVNYNTGTNDTDDNDTNYELINGKNSNNCEERIKKECRRYGKANSYSKMDYHQQEVEIDLISQSELSHYLQIEQSSSTQANSSFQRNLTAVQRLKHNPNYLQSPPRLQNSKFYNDKQIKEKFNENPSEQLMIIGNQHRIKNDRKLSYIKRQSFVPHALFDGTLSILDDVSSFSDVNCKYECEYNNSDDEMSISGCTKKIPIHLRDDQETNFIDNPDIYAREKNAEDYYRCNRKDKNKVKEKNRIFI